MYSRNICPNCSGFSAESAGFPPSHFRLQTSTVVTDLFGHQLPEFVEVVCIAVRHVDHLLAHRVQPVLVLHVVLVFLILLRQYVVVAADDDPSIVQQKPVLDETLDRFRCVHGNQPTIVQSLSTVVIATTLVIAARKGRKERKSIYIAPFCTKVHPKRSGMDHTVLPANIIMPAFPSWRSPDVTTTATEAADIQLQLTTHLSTPKG